VKYIQLLSLLALFGSCNSHQTNTTIYPLDLFTNSEVQEISMMLEEFTKVVCATTQTNSTDCIKAYFENYLSGFKKGRIKTQIDSQALSKIIEPLSENLKSKLFYKTTYRPIHRIPNTTPALSIRDTLNYLSVNIQDSYMPILSHLSDKYDFLAGVKESVQDLNDLSPMNMKGVYLNWNNYNYSENTELLFLSLEIISQTDQRIKSINSYSSAISPIEKELKKRNEHVIEN